MHKRTGPAWAAIAILLVEALSSSTGGARPLVPAEKRYKPYTGVLPFCDDHGVLDRITERFHTREADYWNSGLYFTQFRQIQEIGYRTAGLDYIPRRYCAADVVTNDLRVRRLAYRIGEDTGNVGYTYGVDWCVVGLDRNYADGLNCRALRP